MEGDGVEDGAANAFLLEVLHEVVAAGMANGVLVPDVLVPGRGDRGDSFGFGEQFVVAICDFLSAFCPVIQTVEF